MFERFTPAARAVVTGAVEEAQTMGSGRIGSEHLLLAILRGEKKGLGQVSLAGAGVTYSAARAALERVGEPSSLDADALRALGIDLDQVRRRVEAQFGPGALDDTPPTLRSRWLRRHGRTTSRHLPFTDDAKLALELSLREAIALRSPRIGDGHLLLGLLRGEAGRRARLLHELGVDPGALRTRLTSALRQSA